MRPIFDAHTHLNYRSRSEFFNLAEKGYRCAVVCAYYLIKPRSADTLLDHFDVILKKYTGDFKGLRLYAAVGVHPRSIPQEGVEKVLRELPRYFEDKRVAALGEVGVEKGTEEEKKVLKNQLELAKELGTPVIFHTPRKNKYQMLQVGLRILAEVGIDPSQVVIDHNDEKTAGEVLHRGYYTGLSIHSKKLDTGRCGQIVQKYSSFSNSLILNSDLGYGADEVFSLVNTVNHFEDNLGEELLSKVTCKNALDFFGIEG
ncbi:MAG: TatD family hydrolase [Spirochaetota bacterium]